MQFRLLPILVLAALWLFAAGALPAQQREASAPANSGADEIVLAGDAHTADNAALKYWQAYGALSAYLSRDELDIVEGLNEDATEDQVAAALEKAEPAFKLLHRGARLSKCDWGLDYEDGPHMAMPHLQAVRMLTRFANRRAIYYFEQGKNNEAVDDVLAIYRMGRHTGSDVVNIGLLVDIAVESVATHTLARYLPQLSAEQRKSLAARLDQLPPGGTISEGMLVEMRYFPQWVLDNSRHVKTGEELQEFLLALNVDATNVARIMTACKGDVRRFRDLVRGQFDYHLEVARLFKLDGRQFEQEFAALKQKMESENPVALFWFENAPALHRASVRHKVSGSLLKAAIAVVDEGPEALRRFPDPYGMGPFLYRPRKEGFELQSDFIAHGDRRLTIRVGFEEME